MFKLLFCSLFALPLAASAQSSSPKLTSPKAYVGLGINGGRYYDKRHGEFIGSGLQYSPTVVAGFQVMPRVALQLSANTYDYRFNYTAQGLDYSAGDANNPVVSYISGALRRRYFVLPLLARYTVTGSSQRVKADVLLGATIYHTRERSTTTLSDSQFRVTNQYKYSVAATYANLVVGTGVRYALTPKLELDGELRINPFYFGYSAGFYPNLDVSVRYCWGAPKA